MPPLEELHETKRFLQIEDVRDARDTRDEMAAERPGYPSCERPRPRHEASYGLGDSQPDFDEPDDDEDEPIPEWVFNVLWWPVSFLGFVLRVIGRFSKLAFLLAVSAATYFYIYSAMVPPSLSEQHPINFDFPILHSEREGGVPANATVDFAFQRQLMLRSGARGMDWSSGMAPGSSLDVGVSLELPECQANYNVGTFTVNVTVYDQQGHDLGAPDRERYRGAARFPPQGRPAFGVAVAFRLAAPSVLGLGRHHFCAHRLPLLHVPLVPHLHGRRHHHH